MCTACPYQEYCDDCREETGETEPILANQEFEDEIEEEFEEELTVQQPPATQSCSTIVMNDSYVYYKGIPHRILSVKRGSPNIQIWTERFLFCARHKDNELTLIKAIKLNKNRRRENSRRQEIPS